MAFQEIENTKKSVEIAKQILAAIKEGLYQVGERLPSEEEIAAMTGTSRSSVREALGALQIVGIVEAKAGSGTYVKKAIETPELEVEVLQLLAKEKVGLFEVIEARQMVETGIAEYIASDLTISDIKRLEKVIDDMRKAISTNDWDMYRRANRDFHLVLAGITKNMIIKNIIECLIDMGKNEIWKHLSIWAGDPQLEKVMESFEEHKGILFALKKGDKDLLKNKIKEHFEGTVKRLQHQ